MASDRSDNEDEEEIEVLPDRFDPQGRPLDSRTRSGTAMSGWTQRRGDFAYRPSGGGTHVVGSWGIAGTDPAHVESMVRNVSGVLAGEMPRGLGGWLGLAGRVLGGVMEPPPSALGEGSGSEVSRDGRGKGRRSRGEEHYGDEGPGEESDGMGRRRRRRRRMEELD